MAVKFLEDVGAKLINATRKEMVDAIFAASGRVVIGETVTFLSLIHISEPTRH